MSSNSVELDSFSSSAIAIHFLKWKAIEMAEQTQLLLFYSVGLIFIGVLLNVTDPRTWSLHEKRISRIDYFKSK